MNRYVILVALALSGSSVAQSAPAPQCDNKIVSGFNKQAGQYQLWLGDTQEMNEALQDQIKAAQAQIADLTKKLAEKATPAGPTPTVSPPK